MATSSSREANTPPPGSSTAEIYDPIANTWKYTPAQGYGVIGDAPAKLLTNGDILLAPEVPTTSGTQTTVLYNSGDRLVVGRSKTSIGTLTSRTLQA